MLETMYVRCTQCGYDNSPEYRFCGMCGGSLAHAATETRPPARDVAPPVANDPVPESVAPPAPLPPPYRRESGLPAPSAVHGPSFLGLSEDPKVEFNYLYEDEPRRSHAGLIVILLLLIGGGGVLGWWQWRHNGFPFNRLNGGSAPASSAPAATAVPQNQEAPAAGTPDATAADTAKSSPSEVPSAQTPAESAGSSTATSPPATQGQGPAPAPDEAAPAPAETKETAEVKPAPSPHKPRSKAAPTRPAAATPGVEKAALITAPDADLELAGERYLYGTGLPQNCARAESSLRTAAGHSNSKAETVLGTMYATGHCVGRDLPAAYRWFARALHADPQNSRISADLQVLWRQMTPEEKQLATTSKQ